MKTKEKSQIKSKERVRNLAEVFTAEREVQAMIGLFGEPSRDLTQDIESTFLEPACGDGNFLEALLQRKLETISKKYKKQEDIEFYIIKAVASIYGVDISKDNVGDARVRLQYEVKSFYSNKYNTRKPTEGFMNSVQWILEHNIIVGDMLNGIEKIVFIEYSSPKMYHIKRKEFRLIDTLNTNKPKKGKKNQVLFETTPLEPLKTYRMQYYSNLC
jgi:hypothetical protein